MKALDKILTIFDMPHSVGMIMFNVRSQVDTLAASRVSTLVYTFNLEILGTITLQGLKEEKINVNIC